MIDWRIVSWRQYAQHQQLLKNWQLAHQEGNSLALEAAEKAVVTCWCGTEVIHDKHLVAGLFLSIVNTPLPTVRPVCCIQYMGVTYRAHKGLKLPGKHLIMGAVTFGDALELLQTDELLHDKPQRIPRVIALMLKPDKRKAPLLKVPNLPVPIVLGAYQLFQNFRQQLTETYPPVFKSTADGKAQKAGLNKLNRFGWYNLLYEAADGRLECFEAIKKMSLHTVMQFLVRKREEQHYVIRLQQVYADEARHRNRRP